MGSSRTTAKSTNGKLTFDAAKLLIERYRAALHELMEAKYDWELTAAHVARKRNNDEYEARCYLVARELRRRIEPFRHIEPEWFARMDKQLYDGFIQRDQRNIDQETTGAKRVREK